MTSQILPHYARPDKVMIQDSHLRRNRSYEFLHYDPERQQFYLTTEPAFSYIVAERWGNDYWVTLELSDGTTVHAPRQDYAVQKGAFFGMTVLECIQSAATHDGRLVPVPTYTWWKGGK